MFFFVNKTPLTSTQDFSYATCNLQTQVPIPMGPLHPGAFAFERKNHIHEGVDLYGLAEDTIVTPQPLYCAGYVPFTGAIANLPWWCDTYAMICFSHYGQTIFLGEINPLHCHVLSDTKNADSLPAVASQMQLLSETIHQDLLHLLPHATDVQKMHLQTALQWSPGWYPAGTPIGTLTPVLKKDKGRPMHMLHVEMYEGLHAHSIGTWKKEAPRPPHLLDPTPFLLRWANLAT